MKKKDTKKPDRPLSPVSRRAFLFTTPAALAAGAATLGACGGGGYGDFGYGDCYYCDGLGSNYYTCDGLFYCDYLDYGDF